MKNVEIRMVKVNEILSRSSWSAQKFMHEIRVLMAKNYIDNLSEEVKKGLTRAAQNLSPSFAPPGYRNVSGRGREANHRARSCSGASIRKGFRFRKSGNKIPVATLHKILRDWSNADSRGKRNEI
jgi:site-specific DNA recombinase